MSTKRICHTAKFKFTIALETIKLDKPINQLASDHPLHPSQINQWKRQLLEQGSDIFAIKPTKPWGGGVKRLRRLACSRSRCGGSARRKIVQNRICKFNSFDIYCQTKNLPQ
ncbi:hypothetical protein C6502_04855 [Candidatus Poribacteria bacterium]|nr:MAG: hypothetical protein C6502_04855 [Candidatus Poribacteria bacterium]